MTNTLLIPTDDRKKVDPLDLDDLVSELHGIGSNLQIVSSIVEPKRMQDIDTPSDNTVMEAFYSIIRNIERVADDLEAFGVSMMQEEKTTATPTDESKDCR